MPSRNQGVLVHAASTSCSLREDGRNEATAITTSQGNARGDTSRSGKANRSSTRRAPLRRRFSQDERIEEYPLRPHSNPPVHHPVVQVPIPSSHGCCLRCFPCDAKRLTRYLRHCLPPFHAVESGGPPLRVQVQEEGIEL